ncbi:YgaP family membrane protein [Paludisphaera rhizosphaerae]|uniref:YgaP family membrane protein n=1 Tax=Paludisphaera rhizosphaerae TaxID=2711216 RepID=UPI0013E9C964|nr:DUF2892 domain-containing protein [Paludisphaera rhizosphaerae]
MAQHTMSRDNDKDQIRRQEQEQEEAPIAESCAMHQGVDALRQAIGGLEHQNVNVGDVERVVSVMSGGVLALFGAVRGGLAGLGLAVLGGGLIYRGVTGHCEAYHSLGIDTSDRAELPRASDHGHAHA